MYKVFINPESNSGDNPSPGNDPGGSPSPGSSPDPNPGPGPGPGSGSSHGHGSSTRSSSADNSSSRLWGDDDSDSDSGEEATQVRIPPMSDPRKTRLFTDINKYTTDVNRQIKVLRHHNLSFEHYCERIDECRATGGAVNNPAQLNYLLGRARHHRSQLNHYESLARNNVILRNSSYNTARR